MIASALVFLAYMSAGPEAQLPATRHSSPAKLAHHDVPSLTYAVASLDPDAAGEKIKILAGDARAEGHFTLRDRAGAVRAVRSIYLDAGRSIEGSIVSFFQLDQQISGVVEARVIRGELSWSIDEESGGEPAHVQNGAIPLSTYARPPMIAALAKRDVTPEHQVQTDLVFHNPSATEAIVELSFVSGNDDLVTGALRKVRIPARQTTHFEDAISSIFNVDAGPGRIYVVSSTTELIARSKTSQRPRSLNR